jgi:hypothetical protein
LCDGIDNDCDGATDENLTVPPAGWCRESCGAAFEGGTCIGAAGWICNYDCTAVECNSNNQVVSAETLCDGVDNDCDGATDENLISMVNNCGACGNDCADVAGEHVASLVCVLGECRVNKCEAGYHNLDGNLSCEYGSCIETGSEGTVCNGVDDDCDGLTDNGAATTEVCDGVDNDCDGQTDEGMTAPDICNSRCPAATSHVSQCYGAGGWKCNYNCVSEGGTVDCDGDENTIADKETRCDGVDNNCDGTTDEGFMLWDDRASIKGARCTSDGSGGCSQKGWVKCSADQSEYICCSAQSGTTCAVGNIIPEAPAAGVENGTAADGVDNDCDGVVDDGADGCVESVSITGASGTYSVFKYEASKRTAAQGAPCSEAQGAGTKPWTNVSFEEARDACLRLNDNGIGATCSYDDPDSNSGCWDLCTAQQWYYACAYGNPSASAPHLYPYGASYTANTCNGVEYDAVDGAIPAGAATQCAASWNASDQVRDLSGNVEEWTLDLRTVGATDLRVVRGGSYKTVANGLTCNFDFFAADEFDLQMDQLGFRCCKGSNPITTCNNAIDMLPGHPYTFDVPGDTMRCEGDGWWVNSDASDNWQLGKTTVAGIGTSSCVYGTTLNGNYTGNRDNYLYSTPIKLASCAGSRIDLTWNMYFNNGGDTGDYLALQVRTSSDNGATWGAWTTLGANITANVSSWTAIQTRTVANSIAANTLYQLRFVFHADNDGTVNYGAYLDNLKVIVN